MNYFSTRSFSSLSCNMILQNRITVVIVETHFFLIFIISLHGLEKQSSLKMPCTQIKRTLVSQKVIFTVLMSNGFCNHFIMKGRLMSSQCGFTIQFKTFSFYSLILWGILGIISSSILKIFQEASQKCSLKSAYKNIYPEFHASLI